MTSSPADVDAELDAEILAVAGRRAPFSLMPDWVTMAPISNLAYRLYGALAMHVSATRDDNDVWPVGEVLAAFCRLTSDRHLKKARDELVAIGAIDCHLARMKGGMRHRYIYTVHQTAPEGYDGHVTTKSFYEARNQENCEPATEGTPTSPPEGTRTSPREGTPTSPELEEQEPEEVELEELPSSSPPYGAEVEVPTASADAGLEEEESKINTTPTIREEAAEVLRGVAFAMNFALPRSAGLELLPRVVAAMENGWQPTQLHNYLASNPHGVKHWPAVLSKRLDDIPDPRDMPDPRAAQHHTRPYSDSVAEALKRPEERACGRCDGTWTETEDGLARRCDHRSAA